MEGVTEMPFRLICKRFGADLVYTEFVASEALIRDVEKSLNKIKINKNEKPVAVQIFGGNVLSLVGAAEKVLEVNPDIIDINSGCPVKKVVNKGGGAALMKTPEILVEAAAKIVKLCNENPKPSYILNPNNININNINPNNINPNNINPNNINPNNTNPNNINPNNTNPNNTNTDNINNNITIPNNTTTDNINILNQNQPNSSNTINSNVNSNINININSNNNIINTPIPVTVKLRLGWDNQNINVKDIILQLQDVGVSAVTIHGRTRAQMYRGEANWDIISEIKKDSNITIPIIGNGDIDSAEKAYYLKNKSNVDGLMIGRAAIGNPWIFQQVKHYFKTNEILPEPTLHERVEVCKEHLLGCLQQKEEYKAIIEMRHHYAKYFKGVQNFKQQKLKLMAAVTKDEVLDILDNLENNLI